MKKTSTFTLVRKPASRTMTNTSVGKTSSPTSVLDEVRPRRANLRWTESLGRKAIHTMHNKAVPVKTEVIVKSTTGAHKKFRALGEQAVMRVVGPKLRSTYMRQNENFKATLRSVLDSNDSDLSALPKPAAAGKVKRITEQLARSDRVIKVGVLDLGSWADLSLLTERLNAHQELFTLFQLLSPVPGGLVKTPLGFSEWLVSKGGPNLAPDVCEPHLVFDEFQVAANDIRVAMGMDLLVGITPYRVAGASDDVLFWDHFAATANGTILLSVTDVREYAERAGRPYEAAVGVLLTSALFVAVVERLDFHIKDTGCIFDNNGHRASLVDTIHALRVDDTCMAKLDLLEQQSLKGMLGVLRRMKRKGPQ
jgi:hypothetical protein